MHIHVSDSLSHEQETREYTAQIEADVLDIGTARYPITEKKPVRVRITNTGDKKLLIEAEASFVLIMPCDRCLEDVRVPLSYSVSRTADLGEAPDESEEQAYLDGYDLDVDTLIRDELFVHLPMKVLCREDCKGICNRCGANLNHGTCGCDVTELDPRMAVIRDIFKNSSENMD